MKRNVRLETLDDTTESPGILSRFERWIAKGATTKQRADFAFRERVRNVGLGILVALFGFGLESIEGLRIGVPIVAYSGVLAAAIFVGAIFFLRATQRYVLVGNIVLIGVLAATCANIVFAGGFLNPAIVALFILPIGAAILIDVRASIVWGGVALAAFVAFWLAPRFGIDTGQVPGGIDGLNSLFNRVVVLCGVVAVISLFVASQKRADARIAKALERLALLNEATVAANESTTLFGAIEKCLAGVCTVKGWTLGLAYNRAPSETGAVPAVFHMTETVREREKQFVRDSIQLLIDVVPDDEDLPDSWNNDLKASTNPYRGVLALRLGLRASVETAIDIGDEQWIFEFFSEAPIESDDDFVGTLQFAGLQLERVMERAKTQSHIHDLSYTDSLTRLPNRRHLNDYIQRAVASSPEDKHIAAIQLGLDGFKTINDALGHAVGDQLLRYVANHLVDTVSSIALKDKPQRSCSNCVFRNAGDEFVIVLGEIETPKEVSQLANALLKSLVDPIELVDNQIHCQASIGIAISGLDAHNGPGLLQCANSALSAAKKSGGNQITHFAAALNEESSRRLFLENHLRGAIAGDELKVVYQPLMLATDAKMVGVEALLRWATEGEHVSPVEFIPVAEDSGQIGVIGRWVLTTAAAQLAHWVKSGNGPARIAVNVSVVQLREDDFVDFVTGLVATHKLPTGSLELEITESRLIGSEPEIMARLEQLLSNGIKLSLDDFGTGYSSLSQLKRLPIHKLKIDRSFIDGIETDASNKSLVEAIVGIANDLKLTIVAEGVENAKQAALLRDAGATELQGYLYSKPVSPEEIEELFESFTATKRFMPPSPTQYRFRRKDG